jgi:hypothetical protein
MVPSDMGPAVRWELTYDGKLLSKITTWDFTMMAGSHCAVTSYEGVPADALLGCPPKFDLPSCS